jgi:serine/threonine-protein kinase RsbT
MPFRTSPKLLALQQRLELDVSPTVARQIIRTALTKTVSSPERCEVDGLSYAFLEEVRRALRWYCQVPFSELHCSPYMDELSEVAEPTSEKNCYVMPLETEANISEVCQLCRREAKLLGFSNLDEHKVVTAVYELAQNMLRYAERGLFTITIRDGAMVIEAIDEGPGIDNVEQILSGDYDSSSGLGLGLLGCKRLMDEFAIDTAPGQGTHVTLVKRCRR